MKVLIGTPTAGGIVTTGYANTLVGVMHIVRKLGWRSRYITFDGADIVMARNFIANTALKDPEITHLFFLDSDMKIQPPTLERLFRAEVEIIGAVYTERNFDLERYAQERIAGLPHDQARALASTFNVRLTPGKLNVNSGLCKVQGFGFGAVLIRRSLLERLVETGQAREVNSGKLSTQGLGATMRDFFSEIRNPDGSYLSEDYSFCKRVIDMGGTDLIALVDTEIGHVGSFTYGASFLSRLMAHRRGRETDAPEVG